MPEGMPAKKKTVREYLDSLVWDKKPRLDRWLVAYAGAEDTPRTRMLSRRVLIGAVRCVRRDDCRLEVLELVARQGRGKTLALQVLAGEDAFAVLPFDSNLRAIERALAGKWIVEASDLGKIGLRAEVFKTLVAKTKPFVIVATTNDERGLLDPGTSRRIWPLRVDRFDLDVLSRHRDQLWAEAAAAEAAGEDHRFEDPSA